MVFSRQAAVACGSGEYSLSGEAVCSACPNGSYCASTTAVQTCPANTYSLSGWEACEDCPAGYECPSASVAPVKCGPGYYSALTSK